MILHVDHTELTVSLLSEKTNCKTVCTMLQQLFVSVDIWLGSILIPPVNRTFAVTGRLYACPVHMASTRGWTPQTCLAWLMGLWLIAFNLNLCVCHSVHAHGGQKSPIAFHFAEAVSLPVVALGNLLYPGWSVSDQTHFLSLPPISNSLIWGFQMLDTESSCSCRWTHVWGKHFTYHLLGPCWFLITLKGKR